MPQSHVSGNVRIACSACHKVNEITAINLPWGEPVTCSHCQAPLGAWDVLMAAATGQDESPELPGTPAPA
jgi:hypothetical protein